LPFDRHPLSHALAAVCRRSRASSTPLVCGRSDSRSPLVGTGQPVTVEDHWPEGGLGDAVLAALAESGTTARVRKLAVSGMPGSGTPAELLHEAGIDADAIAAAARQLAHTPASA
jgi:hypothetical protein